MQEQVAKKSSRVEFIDVAKFIGILFVVWAHAVSKNREFIMIAYTFHLPLFFALNGYTLKIRENENFGQYLYRKIKSYVIPIFCIGSILIVTEQILTHHFTFDINYFIDRFVYLSEQKRAFPLWFVGALFCSDLIFYFVVKASKNKLVFVILISFIILLMGIYYNSIRGNVVLLWNFDVSMIGVIFVCVGYILKHPTLAKVHNFVFKKRWIALIIGVVLFTCGCLISKYNYDTYHLHLEMWARQYQKYYLTIPAAILCSYGIIAFSFAISNKVLGELGKTTLIILAFHQILAFHIFNVHIASSWWTQVVQVNKSSYYFLYSTVETIFSMVMLIILHYIFAYSPFAFMIGKKMPQIYKEKWSQFIELCKRKISSLKQKITSKNND